MTRVRELVPDRVKAIVRILMSGGLSAPHSRVSFSQEGEDLLIERLIGDQMRGFYVDVGAHHPTRFSNTYLLYRRGWTGINIDPTPGAMAAFRKKRPRDINLELAIAREPGFVRLFLFDEPALNSMSPDLSIERSETTDYKILDTVEVPARTLAGVLEDHLPKGIENIDLMTIDVEGADLEVLRSNDWSLFRPRILIFEALSSSLEDVMASKEIEYLRERGFTLYAKLVNSVILTDSHEVSAW